MTTSNRIYFQHPPGSTLTVDIRLVGSGVYSQTNLAAVEEPPAGGPYALSNYYVVVSGTLNGTFDVILKSSTVIVGRFQKAIGCDTTAPQIYRGGSSENAFSRLFVDHIFYGRTVVRWELSQAFRAAGPYTFYLQASYAGHENAADWVTIGQPQVNVTQLIDDTARESTGKALLTHYRVVMVSRGRTYVSKGEGIFGTLPRKDWLIAKEITRKELLRLKNNVGVEGFLLRRYRYGVQDSNTVFKMTGDIIDTSKASDRGTGFKGGYHPPVSCLIDMENRARQETRGDDSPPGQNKTDDTMTARIPAIIDLVKEDVWGHTATDERFIVESANAVARVRGVPIVYQVTMQLLPHSHPVYRIPTAWSVVGPQTPIIANTLSYLGVDGGDVDQLYNANCHIDGGPPL